MNPSDPTHDHNPAELSAGAESYVDAVGAYLLDALDEADLAAFEAYLRGDPDLQAEVAALRPVVDLLPLALETDTDDIPEPSSGLRDRILVAARDDGTSAGPRPTHPTIATWNSRPGPTMSVSPQSDHESPGRGGLLSFVRRIGIERLAAGFLAIVAAGAIIWGLSLQNQLNEREDELAALQDDSPVVAYAFTPTADGPPQVSGALSILPGDTDNAVLNLANMPAVADGQVYQAWFIDLDEAGEAVAARPSVTFRPDESGEVKLSEVPFDQPFDAVGITVEPDGGSESPTLPVLMLGTESFAQG